MTSAIRKVLIARVDRIGDLILTLPMESAWKQIAPTDEIFWLVSPSQKFLFEKQDRVFSAETSSELKKILQENKFDVVLSVHVPWWMAFSFWKSGISLRVGVASKWFSWIFYNRRIRQRRSQALKNEALYNLELVAAALPQASSLLLEPYKIKAREDLRAQWKSKIGEGFTVIHPGMGGSARNWPLRNYKALAEKIISQGGRVVVTGSPIDKKIIQDTGILKVNGVIDLSEKTPPADLLAVLSLASSVVAPSTGVAHMAASLGVKTLGLYSPVKVQAPLRWAPLGARVKVFVPEVKCPGVFSCLGPSCSLYDCMEKIGVDTVAHSVLERSL